MITFLKNLSAKYRIFVVASVLWIIFIAGVASSNGLDGGYFNFTKFIILGFFPLALLWGIIWIVQGFKKQT